MNKDQINGNVQEAKGKIKEIAGEITNDKSLEFKGKVEQKIGKAQVTYGDAKQNFEKTRKTTGKRS